MGTDAGLGFAYESSEFIENHSADFAVQKRTGGMLGLLPNG